MRLHSVANKIIFLIITIGLAYGVYTFIVWWHGFRADQVFHQGLVQTTGDVTIGRTTENCDIQAVYPIESRDRDNSIASFVHETVRTAEQNCADAPTVSQSTSITYQKIEAPQLGMVSYVVTNDQYRGGAHGVITTTTFTFDDRQQFVLTDILMTDTAPVMLDTIVYPRIIDALEARNNLDVQTMIRQGLGLDQCADVRACVPDAPLINPTMSFSIADDGLTLIFDPYTVGSYVYGVIKVSIPWEDIMPYVTRDFARRLK